MNDESPSQARRAEAGKPLTPEELYAVARDLPARERSAFLRAECADRPAVAREVLDLLGQADAAEAFFGSLGRQVGSLRERVAAQANELASVRDSISTLPPGSRVGPYEIVEKIGEGGMGAVFRARDPRLNREVALKFLPVHLVAEPRAKKRFQIEARAAAALDHPNVCAIHEIGETSEGRPYLALAFYRGETLKERLERGPLSLEEAVEVASAVARALGAAHACGIVHRDVKPGNVMLAEDGQIKLLDFGLARLSAEARLTPVGLVRGTVAYMAPEQIRGEGGPPSDLWALGVLLYEMLTGRLPFRGDDYTAAFRAILEDEPRPLQELRPDVPRALVKAVARLLQKDPADRFSTAEALLAALAPEARTGPARRWFTRLHARRSPQ